MSDPRRRSSLLDQMAMVAASQRLIEMGLDDDSDNDDGFEDDDDDMDDDENHPHHRVIEEEMDGDLEEELNDLDYGYGDPDDDESMYSGGMPMYAPEHNQESGDISNEGSEELDVFEDLDNPMPLDYQWNPRSSGVLEDSVVSELIMTGASDNNLNDSQPQSMEPTTPTQEAMTIRRPSFGEPFLRRTSYASLKSEGSLHSAPARAGEEPTTAPYDAEEGCQQRPLSIAVPNAEGAALSRRTSQRQSLASAKSFSAKSYSAKSFSHNKTKSLDETPRPRGGSGLLHSFIGKGRSSRRSNLPSVQGHSNSSSVMGNLDNAIASLRNQDSNSEWENVAAAAAVVAATSQGGNVKTRHIQFAVDDAVLVFLTLLNVTNMEDPKDMFTVAPVNKYGYPIGEGTTELEKNGPYSFVLATVKHVHFDEDDRYYTIVRFDTGTEQRADSGWMEPLNDPVAIEASSLAATKTVRSTQDKPIEEEDESGYFQDFVDCLVDSLSWPADFAQSTLIPWYRKQRENAKQHVINVLYGDTPFSCTIRVTGINVLVFCSLIFLFLEVINLAFLPASADYEVAFVGTVVWGILALELLFEVIIRPKNYSELIASEKAFAPSVARHINRFHLIFEFLALLTFIPEFNCLVHGGMGMCDRISHFDRVQASMDAVLGRSNAAAARGHFLLSITALRFFGVVRHWKQMWINNTFQPTKREGVQKWLFRQDLSFRQNSLSGSLGASKGSNLKGHKKKKEDEHERGHGNFQDEGAMQTSTEEDQRLKNAATIGTALMVVNSHRALILMTGIMLIMPLINCLTEQNHVADEMARLLQANNIAAGNDCEYFDKAVESWLRMAILERPVINNFVVSSYVLWAQVLPVRDDCGVQKDDGVITTCDGTSLTGVAYETCDVWDTTAPASAEEASTQFFASRLNLRMGAITEFTRTSFNNSDYSVTVIYNENPTLELTNMSLFFLLLGILILTIYGLQALRSDAIRLVLDPLQRMLKIVLRYAENPLSQDVKGDEKSDRKDDDDTADDKDAEGIGNYETEQLISAITNIANLLRKCWGVAGADIITSNLKRTKDGKTVVFNPTVPGKRVYALFGFVAINGFSDQLRALDRDVMILINDVANVVHGEVYRWALGDSGQCNKNLGAAFLMVFRIGDFSEVHDKKKRATNVVFRQHAKTNAQKSNMRRRNAKGGDNNNFRPPYQARKRKNDDGEGTLQLASLPGIQAFTDRALLGMLKSFAGIHRDKSMNAWKNDFRLSAGVNAYNVDIIYGMDAGWAVEGAVGSEYKIDATYLSPHVNMASRMMSAARQYDVTILLSKAVEELLSIPCRKKLRHLDTVYVKGSKVKQDIFTYDARHQGVDFFLIERTQEQADSDAENYDASIWESDQDLRAMRQHVTDEFMEVFSLGVKQYLAGNWLSAHQNLLKADDMMIETVLEDGYVDYDLEDLDNGRIYDRDNKDFELVRVRNELGDGACRVIMSHMQRHDLIPPTDWDAVRTLSSK